MTRLGNTTYVCESLTPPSSYVLSYSSSIALFSSRNKGMRRNKKNRRYTYRGRHHPHVHFAIERGAQSGREAFLFHCGVHFSLIDQPAPSNGLSIIAGLLRGGCGFHLHSSKTKSTERSKKKHSMPRRYELESGLRQGGLLPDGSRYGDETLQHVPTRWRLVSIFLFFSTDVGIDLLHRRPHPFGYVA